MVQFIICALEVANIILPTESSGGIIQKLKILNINPCEKLIQLV